MGNQRTSTLTLSSFNFPSIPSPNLAWKSKEEVRRALECSGMEASEFWSERVNVEGMKGYLYPSPQI
jgi:hypothetical protein